MKLLGCLLTAFFFSITLFVSDLYIVIQPLSNLTVIFRKTYLLS